MESQENNSNVRLGRCVFFLNLGYGFLEWEKEGVKQPDMFVHYSDLNMDGFRILEPQDEVSFEIGTNYKGQPKAINVTLIKSAKVK